jgi:hypothetical protein
MRRLIYPDAREPIIPFCAAISPTTEGILGEQIGGSSATASMSSTSGRRLPVGEDDAQLDRGAASEALS